MRSSHVTLKISSNSVVCFDLDDTLYNEIDFLRSGYQTIAQSISKDWHEIWAQMFSLYRSGEDAFQYISDRFEIPKAELLSTYRFHKPNINPFDGAIDLLGNIKSTDAAIAIITDGRSVTQRNKLKSLGLLDFLDLILISEETGSEKPDESNFLRVQEQYPEREYCYIGDNFSKDFIGPNRLGWTTIGLLDKGLNIHNHAFEYAQQKAYRPKFIIESLKDLYIKSST